MNERTANPDRRALLAFLEEYWQSLTLRDAVMLRIEALDPLPVRVGLNVS